MVDFNKKLQEHQENLRARKREEKLCVPQPPNKIYAYYDNPTWKTLQPGQIPPDGTPCAEYTLNNVGDAKVTLEIVD
jgi:hypothetical protein